MKAINELLVKQAKLEKEIADLSNGQARVGTRENTIEIDTTGMSEDDARKLFHLATNQAAIFVQNTKAEKQIELDCTNAVLTKVEDLLGELS